MTTTVTWLARKGGVGKSTMTGNLGAALALAGSRVLIVDSDGQGNATQAVGLEPRDDFHNVIVRGAAFESVIRPVPLSFTGAEVCLDILSSADLQRKAEAWPETPTQMVKRFAELEGRYDYVIADTSPGATQVHTGWYYASQYVLLPSLCEEFSVRSVEKTREFLDQADKAGRADGFPAAQILGIVPNRFRRNNHESSFQLGKMYGEHHDLTIFDPLRELNAWLVATRQHRSIYNLATGLDRTLKTSARNARLEFKQVVECVLETAPVMAGV